MLTVVVCFCVTRTTKRYAILWYRVVFYIVDVMNTSPRVATNCASAVISGAYLALERAVEREWIRLERLAAAPDGSILVSLVLRLPAPATPMGAKLTSAVFYSPAGYFEAFVTNCAFASDFTALPTWSFLAHLDLRYPAATALRGAKLTVSLFYFDAGYFKALTTGFAFTSNLAAFPA